MNRGHNYAIGRDAEKRIVGKLESLGAEEVHLNTNGNAIPDLAFSYGHHRYVAECKSLLGVHSQGRMGVAKLSHTEFDAMNHLNGPAIKCLIVELRPKTTLDYSYLYVPWADIRTFYRDRKPEQASLTFWWLLNHGLNLIYFLKILEVV